MRLETEQQLKANIQLATELEQDLESQRDQVQLLQLKIEDLNQQVLFKDGEILELESAKYEMSIENQQLKECSRQEALLRVENDELNRLLREVDIESSKLSNCLTANWQTSILGDALEEGKYSLFLLLECGFWVPLIMKQTYKSLKSQQEDAAIGSSHIEASNQNKSGFSTLVLRNLVKKCEEMQERQEV